MNTSKYYFSGKFGIERETLRTDSHGRLAQTPHPFGNDKHISRSVPGERERFEIVSRFIAETAPMPREACAEEFLGYYSEMQKAIKELQLLYGFFCQPRMNVSAPIFSRKRTSCSAMSIVGW